MSFPQAHSADQTEQHDPRAAALRMAVQPTLASLDDLLAAIRALQFQADQDITRLLKQNAELLEALTDLRNNVERDMSGYWTESTSNFMQQADAAIASCKRKASTRTDDDVEDDARAIREEAGQ